jgi:1-aminocyclopropane-1-carboxylate deaminase/D-cysteine desulfhydrase-like pyridoxal-dependent ACC family enzyme
MKSLKGLTPVEKKDGILFKRDDLYAPFSDTPVNGGKVRQLMVLVDRLARHKSDTLITGTSVISPQGYIVARVARHFGMAAVICFGATRLEKILEKKMYAAAHKWDFVRYDCECKLGYDSVLQARIKKIIEAHPAYNVKFGMNLESCPEAIIDSVANQCKNLPAKLDALVILVGSGITMGGILIGLKKFNKSVRRIIGVQISGYDRMDTIDKICPFARYEFTIFDRFPYSKQVKTTNSFSLDPIYEAKAFVWLQENRTSLGEDVLFWIVGNTTLLR